MKLYASTTSPYVRKVLIVAHEAGVADRIERLPMTGTATTRDMNVVAHNPLGQVPTMVLDDGRVLADSRVICEYLDSLGKAGMVPAGGDARWNVLTEHSIADGALVALLLIRYETFLRPESLRWADWTAAQWAKVHSALDYFEARANGFGERFDIALATVICVVSYMDLRMPDAGWRSRAPRLARWYGAVGTRLSVAATALKA